MWSDWNVMDIIWISLAGQFPVILFDDTDYIFAVTEHIEEHL